MMILRVLSYDCRYVHVEMQMLGCSYGDMQVSVFWGNNCLKMGSFLVLNVIYIIPYVHLNIQILRYLHLTSAYLIIYISFYLYINFNIFHYLHLIIDIYISNFLNIYDLSSNHSANISVYTTQHEHILLHCLHFNIYLSNYLLLLNICTSF